MTPVSTTARRLLLQLSEDEAELQTVVRAFLADVTAGHSADRPRWSDLDPDGRLWGRLSTELGVTGLGLPEAVGGQGFGVAELAVVFGELGRALAPAPALGSLGLAARTLLHSPDSPLRDKTLALIADGDALATATTGAPGDVRAGGAGRLTLHGTTGAVLDADTATTLVVQAATSAGPVLAVVGRDAPGVRVVPVETVDLTRGFARVGFEATPGEALAGPEQAPYAVSRGLAEATVLLAAQAAGAARAALDEAVSYATIRKQFGRPIGSFQALKHRLADVLVAVEGAWVTSRYAARLADAIRGPGELPELWLSAGVAKAAAAQAQLYAASEDIRIHGGIGFTWEHRAHLRFRRAKSDEVLLGLPRDHHERSLSLLGFPAEEGVPVHGAS